jgi:DNA-binding MarR family transcriptional regulator
MPSVPRERGTGAQDPLVSELETRLTELDLHVAARVADARTALGLSPEEARLLAVLATRTAGMTPSDLAQASGMAIGTVYPAVHRLRRHRYAHETMRRYSPTDAGRSAVASVEAARRAGIEAYVAQLAPDDRQRLEDTVGVPSHVG